MTWKQLTRVAALAVCALCASAGVAPAQHTCPSCRTALGPSSRDKDCGICGLRQYPLLEFRYIRQFCKPTICPSSCFGHFKTQWTPWSAGCPNWSEGNTEHIGLSWGPPAHPSYVPPGAVPPVTAPEVKSNDVPEAPKKPTVEPAPTPKMPAKESPAAPAPLKVDPPKGTDPGGRPGISVPPIPDLPVNIPTPLPGPPPVSPVKY